MTFSGLFKAGAAALLLGGMIGAPAAEAADAGQFLKQLAGDYRGHGTAKLKGRDTAEKVSCKISNRYDDGAKALVVQGNCASTQAKTAVSGKMVHSGGNVTGSLFSSGESTMTKSTGSVTSGKLTVTTNFVDNTTHQLTRTLQVIRASGGGFVADFFVYDNGSGKFEPTGKISFSGS